MKLVIAVVQDTDAEKIMEVLGKHGYSVTEITSAGGFLRETNVTLLIGVDAADVPAVVDIVERNSTARRKFVNPLMPFAPVRTGEDSSVRVGASVFIVNVSRFVRLRG